MIEWRYRVGISATLSSVHVRGPYRADDYSSKGDASIWEAAVQQGFATPITFSWVRADTLADATKQAGQLIEGKA